ncbi:hypothetical protein ACUOCP_46915, partial [Escherichia sp. R-CC3]
KIMKKLINDVQDVLDEQLAGLAKAHSTMVFIGIQLPEDEIRAAFAGLKK